MLLPKVLQEVLSLPTAPFHEEAVLAVIEAFCRRLKNVTMKYDRYGNLLVRYRYQAPKRTPIAFVAHTDHPGFISGEMKGRKALLAEFRGGVRPEYFAGSKVRFWHEERWIKGRVTKLTKIDPPSGPGRPPVPKEAGIEISKPVPPGCLGMWDLPDAKLQGDRIVARACDDLAGVAALLALLERLDKRRAKADVYCLFTRAEEVGFVGAVGAIRAKVIPKRVPVVSIETSSALVSAKIGDGPIVRIGDRMVVYTPRFAAFAARVAQDLAQRKSSFQYQRKLMDGGMCEAAAFGCYGYDVIGICLALGNYHNMNTKRKRIGSEWVSYRDWRNMVDLFEALVLDKRGPTGPDDGLKKRIDKLFDDQAALLG